jgi:hypothetical protein
LRLKRIRSGRGLGDALYLQAVTRHLVAKGQKLIVCCDWPEVFKPLKGSVVIEPFTRNGINILAHYSMRKIFKDTTQFRDCCLQAGITEKVELKLDWKPSSRLTDNPYLVVQLPRQPMNRPDGFGMELLPDCNVIQDLINHLKDRFTIVQVGAGRALYQFKGVDIDLANKTSVSELLDVVHGSAGVIGYCSFIVPLAESFDKPGLFVWSRRGLNAKHEYIKTITPRKILEKPTDRYLIDDCSDAEILEAAASFMQ